MGRLLRQNTMRPRLMKTSLQVHKSSRHLAKLGSTEAVTYCTSDHLSVMTQLYGSVWPRVFPLCLANTIFCACIWVVDRRYDSIDFSIDPSGHKYLAALLSFLVIARVRIIYNYSIKARENLSIITQNAHDLVEHAAVLTCENNSLEAMEWRRNVALGVIEFVIDCMDALSFNSEISDIIEGEEAEKWRNMTRRKREEIEKKQVIIRKEKFRKPTLTAMALKKSILSHRYKYGTELKTLIARPAVEMRLLCFVETCQNGEETQKSNSSISLLSLLSKFTSNFDLCLKLAFYQIDGLINTPFPFRKLQALICASTWFLIIRSNIISTVFSTALVQMGRMILIFWVLTLPFALQHSPYPLWGECMLIFLLTFGFFGLEFVCIEMSDPFGTDANDFDQVNLARVSFHQFFVGFQCESRFELITLCLFI